MKRFLCMYITALSYWGEFKGDPNFAERRQPLGQPMWVFLQPGLIAVTKEIFFCYVCNYFKFETLHGEKSTSDSCLIKRIIVNAIKQKTVKKINRKTVKTINWKMVKTVNRKNLKTIKPKIVNTIWFGLVQQELEMDFSAFLLTFSYWLF